MATANFELAILLSDKGVLVLVLVTKTTFQPRWNMSFTYRHWAEWAARASRWNVDSWEAYMNSWTQTQWNDWQLNYLPEVGGCETTVVPARFAALIQPVNQLVQILQGQGDAAMMTDWVF